MNDKHYTYSNPHDAFAEMINSQMLPWPRRPLSSKPKGNRGQGKSRSIPTSKFKGHTSIKRKMY